MRMDFTYAFVKLSYTNACFQNIYLMATMALMDDTIWRSNTTDSAML